MSSLSVLHTQLDTLSLFDIENLEYQGAYRISSADFGSSSLNYSQGPILYNPTNHSMFIVGHAHHQNIAEFSIPELSLADSIKDLQKVDEVMQNFSWIIPDDEIAIPQNMDRIGGMMLYEGQSGTELLVNCYEYYDAPADNTLSSLIVKEPTDLENSKIKGFFKVEGGAGHTCRWYSPIPEKIQEILGGSDITASGSGLPINSRLPVGPSAFSFEVDQYVDSETDQTIATNTLLDYDLSNPIKDYSYENYDGTIPWLFNDSLDKTIWTYVTNPIYGIIVPNSRTYLVIGSSGGLDSGVCYKCTQDTGYKCGGYCSRIAADNYHFYWSFDLQEMYEVKAGIRDPYDIRPYAYGKLDIPFEHNGLAELGGGTFDEDEGIMYLSLNKGDLEQGTYARPPLILAYKLNMPIIVRDIETEEKLEDVFVFPNPAKSSDLISIRSSISLENARITIRDLQARLVYNDVLQKNNTDLDLSRIKLTQGVYILSITNEYGFQINKRIVIQ